MSTAEDRERAQTRTERVKRIARIEHSLANVRRQIERLDEQKAACLTVERGYRELLGLLRAEEQADRSKAPELDAREGRE